MPAYRTPPSLKVSLDPWAALVALEYLRLAAAKPETAPTLRGMLNYVSRAIQAALQASIPPIRGEHLAEQSEAHLQEMLRGVDRIWEDTMQDMEADGEGQKDGPP